jgi:hypothetical protein
MLKDVAVMQSRTEDSILGTKKDIGRWCSEVERDWRDRLVERLGFPWVETEVAWRERWIGRLDTFVSVR